MFGFFKIMRDLHKSMRDTHLSNLELQGHVAGVQLELMRIHRLMERMSTKETSLMTSVQEIQAKADTMLSAVNAERDVSLAVKAVVEHQLTTLADIKQQLADALAAGNTSAADLQKLSDTIDQIMSTDAANADIVAAAVVAGTDQPAPPSGGDQPASEGS